jgi:hypothetical protein
MPNRTAFNHHFVTDFFISNEPGMTRDSLWNKRRRVLWVLSCLHHTNCKEHDYKFIVQVLHVPKCRPESNPVHGLLNHPLKMIYKLQLPCDIASLIRLARLNNRAFSKRPPTYSGTQSIDIIRYVWIVRQLWRHIG